VRYNEGDYRHEVYKSISFIGQDVDFFMEVKVQCLLEIARQHFTSAEDLTVLDVGCGVGLTDRLLVGSFSALHGVDISHESINSAADANPTVEYRAYDGAALPFPDGIFDLAFAINVLHHVPPNAREHFAQEMGRVLRPGGLAVIMEHNPYNPLTRLAVYRCSFDKDAVLLRMATAKRLLWGAGFRSVNGRHILFFPFRSTTARIAENRLGWCPLGAQYYLVGHKPTSNALEGSE